MFVSDAVPLCARNGSGIQRHTDKKHMNKAQYKECEEQLRHSMHKQDRMSELLSFARLAIS